MGDAQFVLCQCLQAQQSNGEEKKSHGGSQWQQRQEQGVERSASEGVTSPDFSTFPSGHTYFTTVKPIWLESLSRLRILVWNVNRSLALTFGWHLAQTIFFLHTLRNLKKKESQVKSSYLETYPKWQIPHTCMHTFRIGLVWCNLKSIWPAWSGWKLSHPDINHWISCFDVSVLTTEPLLDNTGTLKES